MRIYQCDAELEFSSTDLSLYYNVNMSFETILSLLSISVQPTSTGSFNYLFYDASPVFYLSFPLHFQSAMHVFMRCHHIENLEMHLSHHSCLTVALSHYLLPLHIICHSIHTS